MEGTLSKFVNVLYRWQERYFILHGDTLVYSEKKGSPIKGRIHLKICGIILIPDDPLRIILNTGTKEMHLKAASMSDKIKWVNALRAAQEEAINHSKEVEQYQQVADVAKDLSPAMKQYLTTPNADQLSDRLARVWELQAQIDETVSLLSPHLERNPALFDLADRLGKLCNEMKVQLTTCVTGLEQDKIRLAKLIKVMEAKMDKFLKRGASERFFDAEDRIDDEERFFDANSGDFGNESPVIEQRENPQNIRNEIVIDTRAVQMPPPNAVRTLSSPLQPATIPPILDSGLPANKAEVLEFLQRASPVKYRLLISNPAFEGYEYPHDRRRLKLPFFRNPQDKVKVWSVIKDFLGKDLSTFAVPVYLNEPLSMLQRFCEALQYSELLDKADREDDSLMRMAYVVAFAFSMSSQIINRIKKPFNPLLHETFEYLDPDRGVRYISEQVSHHPPISAGHAEAPNFIFWGDTQIKSTFSIKSLSFTPIGSDHLVLKRHRDHFVYNRPTTSVRNLILGVMYLESHGSLTFTNYTTGDSATLVLEERGWQDRGAFEAHGEIKDKSGSVIYKLEGRWDKNLRLLREGQPDLILWERAPAIPFSEEQYSFSELTLQLNHLNVDSLLKIAPTDSRLRPDQRAWEYGNADLAAEEKHRLEEKQRAIRKTNEKTGIKVRPRWFTETIDEYTGERAFVYSGGYWEARETGDFGSVPDIY